MILDCWLQWLQTNGTWAAWALFFAAVIAGILAGIDLYFNRKHVNQLKQISDTQQFNTLLQDIAGEEASHDRGLVRSKIPLDEKSDKIRTYVEKGRITSGQMRIWRLIGEKFDLNETKINEGLIGIGIERTIVRYDRLASFLLSDKEGELRLELHGWLWKDVNMIWLKLHNWIDHRRTTDDPEYEHSQYAIDLQRLWERGQAQGKFEK